MTFPNDYKRVQQPGGNTADAGSHVGLYNQLIIDNDTRAIRLLDGATPGGVLIPNLTTITNLIANQTGGVKADYDGASIADVPDKPATRWSPTQLKKIFNEYFDVANGIVLNDGAMPLQRRNSAQLVTDMNVALKSGWYRIAPSTGLNMPGDTPTSSPDQMMFMVIQSADSDLTQFLYSRDLTQKLWIRGRIGSTWGAWALATGVTAADLLLKMDKTGGVFSGDVGMTTQNGGSLSGPKNRFQNFAHQVDTRGFSAGVAINGTSVVDGWNFKWVGTGVITSTRIAGTKVPFAIQGNVSTAQAVIGAGDVNFLSTAIEGINFADALFGTVNAKSLAVALSMKFPTAGTWYISFANSTQDRSYVVPVVVPVANVLQDIDIVIPGDVTGTWQTDSQIGIYMNICMACGTSFQTATTGAWIAGNFRSGSGTPQPNGMATIGNKMVLENPRLVVGNKSIPTEWLPADEHARRARRYCNFVTWSFFGYAAGTGGAIIQTMLYPSTMRAVPTVLGATAGTQTNVSSFTEAVGTESMVLSIVATAGGQVGIQGRTVVLNAAIS